jgi:hypothetical protein
MPVLPGVRSVALALAALLLCAAPSLGQTMILVPDPNPEPPTAFVDLVYPKTTAYLKANFPDLLQQIAINSPVFDDTLSPVEIGRIASSLIRDQRIAVSASVFVAAEEEHIELLEAYLSVITDMQDAAGEVECSSILARGLGTQFAFLEKLQLADEFAPRVDALAKRHFEIAAAHPDGATVEEMEQVREPNFWYQFLNYMFEKGVPQTYVEELWEPTSNYEGSGILCTAYIRALSALLAAPGEDGVLWRGLYASYLDLL